MVIMMMKVSQYSDSEILGRMQGNHERTKNRNIKHIIPRYILIFWLYTKEDAQELNQGCYSYKKMHFGLYSPLCKT